MLGSAPAPAEHTHTACRRAVGTAALFQICEFAYVLSFMQSTVVILSCIHAGGAAWNSAAAARQRAGGGGRGAAAWHSWRHQVSGKKRPLQAVLHRRGEERWHVNIEPDPTGVLASPGRCHRSLCGGGRPAVAAALGGHGVPSGPLSVWIRWQRRHRWAAGGLPALALGHPPRRRLLGRSGAWHGQLYLLQPRAGLWPVHLQQMQRGAAGESAVPCPQAHAASPRTGVRRGAGPTPATAPAGAAAQRRQLQAVDSGSSEWRLETCAPQPSEGASGRAHAGVSFSTIQQRHNPRRRRRRLRPAASAGCARGAALPQGSGL